MVQVTMPKPYIKYKIISSSRSWDICYESVNGRTRWLQYSPHSSHSMNGGIKININQSLIMKRVFKQWWSAIPPISTHNHLSSRRAEIKLPTVVVIGTNCIGRRISSYHTIPPWWPPSSANQMRIAILNKNCQKK